MTEAEKERAAIVAWLRAMGNHLLAGRIERRDHLKSEGREG